MNRLYAIAVLFLALCISVGINIRQYLAAFELEKTAPLKAQIQTYEVTARIDRAVSTARAADGAELERLRRAVAQRQTETIVRWRTITKELPPPACAPGHERVAAWNKITKEESP